MIILTQELFIMSLCGTGKLKIKDLENLRVRDPEFRVMRDKETVKRYRDYFLGTDKVVGFVGGVYDRLGDGHIKYLLKCMEECDVLIVALDSDELTRKRKNDPLRPWDNEEKRARILSWCGLAHIVTFRNAEEHPYDLIKLLCPDVMFTSRSTADVTDEDRKNLQEFCGKVVVFDPQSTAHTSDEFLRFEVFHTTRAAERIVTVVNEMLKPYGKTVKIGDQKESESE